MIYISCNHVMDNRGKCQRLFAQISNVYNNTITKTVLQLNAKYGLRYEKRGKILRITLLYNGSDNGDCLVMNCIIKNDERVIVLGSLFPRICEFEDNKGYGTGYMMIVFLLAIIYNCKIILHDGSSSDFYTKLGFIHDSAHTDSKELEYIIPDNTKVKLLHFYERVFCLSDFPVFSLDIQRQFKEIVSSRT